MSNFNHFDQDGNAIMVDISRKEITERVAVASCDVLVRAETMALILKGNIKKGDVLSVARLAGILGAKKTPDLIPLCHPLALSSAEIDLRCDEKQNIIEIISRCKINGRTGVEMEALTAVSVAALTIYDMCKAVDRGIKITNIRLLEKVGGKSGQWREQ
ncbi:MAG: cyclic pyranopterin monophosphate synthase MoaC [Pseudomonadota bacterium]|jgi:cyclic pyranopterin phosphate synthase|nr:cyclic pyranopterin monophosphate synthase MoaC [Rhodospirillaceae bacterium]MEC7805683.1 cyclic pyranopterin monophosphate synthase MoaC [Pseudomonadota bacterium]MEC7971718.1 cyclic pyranopterin monophosphate synthase MoaC [Pseudomonadota bacterium]|tara:strand:+ start:4223 stop:4699 length:477 start_codon:yes stop_codon:yes gene_type:complete